MPTALVDAATLINFAEAGRLDTLGSVLDLSGPTVCEAVHAEITAGVNQRSDAVARSILGWSGIGDPLSPTTEQLLEVEKCRIALATPGDPPAKHLGEAQSIVLAEAWGCLFITDDFSAYDFAAGRLGSERVWDTVQVLNMAMANGDINAATAVEITEAIRDAGRSLRRCHPDPMTESDFDV